MFKAYKGYLSNKDAKYIDILISHFKNHIDKKLFKTKKNQNHKKVIIS